MSSFGISFFFFTFLVLTVSISIRSDKVRPTRSYLSMINAVIQSNCTYQKVSGKFCPTRQYYEDLEELRLVEGNVRINDRQISEVIEKYCCTKLDCLYECVPEAGVYSVVKGFPDNLPLLAMLEKMIQLRAVLFKKSSSAKSSNSIEDRHHQVVTVLRYTSCWDIENGTEWMQGMDINTLRGQVARNTYFYAEMLTTLFPDTDKIEKNRIFEDYSFYMTKARHIGFPRKIDTLVELYPTFFEDLTERSMQKLKNGTASCELTQTWQIKVGYHSETFLRLISKSDDDEDFL